MCKQYIYITLCHTNLCKAILGSKKRNCYCSEARLARRFGRCSSDVEVITKQNDTKAHCSDCKLRKKLAAKQSCWQAEDEDENEHDIENCETITSTEIKDSEDEDEKSTTGSTTSTNTNTTTSTSTTSTQFTSYYSAADCRFSATSTRQVADHPSPEPQLKAQAPVKPRGKKRKAVELLKTFESDLTLLEAEYGVYPSYPKPLAPSKRVTPAQKKKQTQEDEEKQQKQQREQEFTVVKPEPEPTPKRNRVPRGQTRCATAEKCPHMDTDDTYPYGFKGMAETEAKAESNSPKRGTCTTYICSLQY